MRSSTVAFAALLAVQLPSFAGAETAEPSGSFLRSFLDRAWSPSREAKLERKPEAPKILGQPAKPQDFWWPWAPLLQPTEPPRTSGTVTTEESPTVAGAIALPPGAAKTYGADVLTPDQIASCVETAQFLDETTADLEAEGARLVDFAAQVKQGNAALVALLAELSTTNPAGAAGFNDRAAAFNAFEQEYRLRFESWATQGRQLDQKFADYNAGCTKQFFPDDMQGVLTRLGISP
jgi:hypothetical protein